MMTTSSRGEAGSNASPRARAGLGASAIAGLARAALLNWLAIGPRIRTYWWQLKATVANK